MDKKTPKLVLDVTPEITEESKVEDFLVVSEMPVQELSAVKEFAEKIDLTNSAQIIQYGVAAQTKVSSFSEAALSKIRNKDMDEIGKMVTNLVTELKGFSPDEPQKKGLKGFLQKAGRHFTQLREKYTTVEKSVDRISGILEDHKMILLKDVAMLDNMYELNLTYFKELSMYILAGRQKLDAVINNDLPTLQQKAQESGKTEDADAANYLAEMCNRFDKKLHDLDLTRTICLQMGPQIRLVQNSDSIMVEKIQSSLVNTIPLWKNQMVLALSLEHSKKATEAHREVTDMTNELLKKNAEMLKVNTVETAKESERSIVDVQTLVQTNQSLIESLDEVMKIQAEGREQRRQAEVQLVQIEEDLKAKLLDISGARNAE